MKSLTEIFDAFNNQKVMVIGDLMIDSYFYGKVERISPEAPVPVVAVEKKEHRLGGAANVALNLNALGAHTVLCGVVGDDVEAITFTTLMQESQLANTGIVTEKHRPTTVKTRIIGNNHQVLRVDSETTRNISQESQHSLIEIVKSQISQCNVLIFEDYNKGVLSPELIEKIIEIAKANQVPIVVDPKLDNFFAYKGVTLFKPNRKEVKEGLKTDSNLLDLDEVKQAMHQLLQALGCEQVMITLSEKGVLIGDKQNHHQLPAHPRKIVDVSGAGDTVISVAALCTALKLDMQLTAALSNLAGGLVCEKLGVVPIDKATLLAEAQAVIH